MIIYLFSAKLGKDARRSRSAKYIDPYSGAPIAEKKGNVKVKYLFHKYFGPTDSKLRVASVSKPVSQSVSA